MLNNLSPIGHTDSLPSTVFEVFAESILNVYTKYLNVNTNTFCFKTSNTNTNTHVFDPRTVVTLIRDSMFTTLSAGIGNLPCFNTFGSFQFLCF